MTFEKLAYEFGKFAGIGIGISILAVLVVYDIGFVIKVVYSIYKKKKAKKHKG